MIACGPCCWDSPLPRPYCRACCCLSAPRARDTFTSCWGRSRTLGGVRITHAATPSFDADAVVFRNEVTSSANCSPCTSSKRKCPDCFVAGLLRLKGNHDPTPELEEMKREKEEADREARVSVLSLVRIVTEKKEKRKVEYFIEMFN